MRRRMTILLTLIVTLTSMTIGCNKDQRLADMAERNLQRQDEQNRRMAELQDEVAQGARELVEADSRAREEMIGVHHDIQAERSEIGRQRDVLEEERRDFASKRQLDPIIAEAINKTGLLLACVLPLILCWYLLRRPPEPVDDQELAEILLEDLVADHPSLLSRVEPRQAIGSEDSGTRCLPNESESEEKFD